MIRQAILKILSRPDGPAVLSVVDLARMTNYSRDQIEAALKDMTADSLVQKHYIDPNKRGATSAKRVTVSGPFYGRTMRQPD